MQNVVLQDRQLLAMHWNRYHVASVPCFTHTLPDCTFPPTTYCDVFNQHWETTHSETTLTTALASAAVSLAVNPLYFHDPRRDGVAETSIRPRLDCPVKRSLFDQNVQLSFQRHCIDEQTPLVDTNQGFYSVIDRPPSVSRQTGKGLKGTFGGYKPKPADDGSSQPKRQRRR